MRLSLGVGILPATPKPATVPTRARGLISVDDYSGLAGAPATGSFTITDYTHLVGASLDLFGFITLFEGVDFTAGTSNNATAQSIADAIDTAVEEESAEASGAVVTMSLPASMDGESAIWSVPMGGGLTPLVVTASGGFPATVLTVASGGQPFSTVDPGAIDPGSSNEECAENIAAWLNLGAAVTAVVTGSIVAVTAIDVGTTGNSYALTQTPQGGVGTISGGLSFSGPTLTGGID